MQKKMAEIGELDLCKIKTDLIIAHRESYERRLLQASKWATEISSSLDTEVNPKLLRPKEEPEEFWKEYDQYVQAKTYFDLKEYDRAVHTLKDCSTPKPNFLRLYALYMSDQKRKTDNMPDSNAQLEPFENEVLKILQAELSEKAGKKELDGFGLYLYGVVLIKLDLTSVAIEVLVQSVTMEPLNWAAWMELAQLFSDREALDALQLPSHWIKHLFMAKVYKELHLHDKALAIYTAFMENGFSKCSYIVAGIAVTYHDMRELEKAVQTFKHLEKMDPYRLENMDMYSNLLYIQESKSELAHLAHRCCTINKYCVETCCVIGNYYSLRSQHEKAVLYFQRALKLNCNYISAWTLMGHEYIEMKNTSAAIQAYRRAIEVNKRDYRAWYGLGQTYEILKLLSYSLYYYRQAQMLKPYDSRMVFALGECYQKLDRLQEAKKFFWKAHCLGDAEGVAIFKLANLYEVLEEEDQACQAFKEYIKHADALQIHNHENSSHAFLYLSNYYIRHKSLDEAYAAAQKCLEFPETREEAKALLKTIQNMRGQEGSETGGGGVAMNTDDSMDSLVQTDMFSGGGGGGGSSSSSRPFGRVTPVNLKFTP